MDACSTVFHLSWKKEFQLNSVFSWLHLAKNKAWAAPLIIIFLNLFIYFFSGFTLRKTSRGRRACTSRLREARNVSQRPHNRPPSLWKLHQSRTNKTFLVGWLTLEYWLTVCAIGPQVFPSRAVLLPWLNRWVVSRFGFGSENFRFGFGSGDSRQDLSVSPPGQSWAVQSKTEKCCSLLKLVNVWRRKNNTLSRIRPPGRWKTSRASPLKRK